MPETGTPIPKQSRGVAGPPPAVGSIAQEKEQWCGDTMWAWGSTAKPLGSGGPRRQLALSLADSLAPAIRSSGGMRPAATGWDI